LRFSFGDPKQETNDSFWPEAEGRDFPKQDVQAAAFGKSSRLGPAVISDPKLPYRLY
jgi:hypothetical protein